VTETAVHNRPHVIACPDLGAFVHLGSVPEGVLDELPDLYGSLFSTETWFRIVDQTEPSGACILQDPRHVLLFRAAKDTVDVLNKAFPMAPADAGRACAALFRALPRARRIHLEVLFPPAQLTLPKRALYWADDLVVDLPATVAEYTASLGKSTRKNLRNFENRLRRQCPDVTTETFVVGDRSEAVMALFLRWHLARLGGRGIVSGYESRAEQPAQVAALIGELGRAQVTTIEGSPAAIEFVFHVGREATLYAGSFDERFADLHLGFLSTYWAICQAIREGALRCHLLWSTDYYKSLLGAKPVRATRLSVFCTQLARVYSLREGAETARRRITRSGPYWRARHVARRLTGRQRPGRRI
jgi:hypothetical protein